MPEDKDEEIRIGVYICHCGTNIAGTVDVAGVSEIMKDLPHVVVSKEYKYMCSDPGQDLIKEDIKKEKLNRVVVASCSPLLHEATFRNACEEAGLNPFYFQMVNIREHDSWVHTKEKDKATDKAVDLIRAAVLRVAEHKALEKKHIPVNPNVLIVGGGIAGIQAALTIADAGKKVYLVEREPTIGGHMAKFDKTFPTLDCAACILTPKMTEVPRNKNIELLAFSEVTSVDGYVGNYKVNIRKNPTYVDWEKCKGCGDCTIRCPINLPNEFDLGLSNTKAIYLSFPQAVPMKYTIHKRGMQPCRAECPAGVGAPGYMTLVAHGKFYEALQVIKDHLPFPSICGRVCHRPCEKVCARKDVDEPVGIAHVKRFVGDMELEVPAAHQPPPVSRAENVAIVGGGPAGLTAAHDLAMMGYHVTIYESAPVLGGMMRWGIPAFRLPRPILRREMYDILSLGIKVHRNTTIGKDMTIKDLFDRGFSAVFLGVGAQKGKGMGIPGEDLKGVYQATEFLKDVNLEEVITTPIAIVDMEKCTGCGLCAEPCAYRAVELEPDEKNPKKKYPIIHKQMCTGCGKCAFVCPTEAIKLTGYRTVLPKTGGTVLVVGGGNAALDAARSALRLGAKDVTIVYRRSRLEMPAEPEWEIDETEREGVKLKYLATPTKVIGNEKGEVKAVEFTKMKLGEPDESGRRRTVPVPKSEFTMEADTLILAIGQEVDATLLLKDTSIECTPGGTIKADPLTMETSMKGVFTGGDSVIGAGTIIEAIAAGKEAAISIDRYINGKDLREDRGLKPKIAEVPLEGIRKKRKVPMRYMPIEDRANNFTEVELGYSEDEAIEEARRCLTCGGCSECLECVRTCEAGAIVHDMREEDKEVEVGSIILATGFKTFDPVRLPFYGYGKYPNVYTALEVERLLNASGPTEGKLQLKDGSEPKSVGIVHCIGSRDTNTNEYCSRVCCMYSLKLAHLIKEHTDAEIFNFYIDMRSPGKAFEEFYNRIAQEGVNFIRGKVADVYPEASDGSSKRIVAVAEDTLIGKVRKVPLDMLVLSVGLEAQPDAKEVRRLFNITCSEEGFFHERHPKLAPVNTFTDGVFLAGCCQGPKDIPDTVAQAGAAASEALALIEKGEIELEANYAYVIEDDCSGCKSCIVLCPYSAITFDEEKKKVSINEALCKGCGVCVAACPSSSIKQNLFEDIQIMNEIKGILTSSAISREVLSNGANAKEV
jgi:heterodisulfide reductase subunit A-like polyferredoxin